jgi:hypothetical protein
VIAAFRRVPGNKGKKPVASAVIYLQNVRTLAVKTYLSEDRGQYHFSGLDPDVDYKLHAEHNDQTSSNHTISSFKSSKEMVVILKIDRNRKNGDKQAIPKSSLDRTGLPTAF